jgi:hypothetical protein
VRQYRPSDLLPAIGATSIEFFESETWQKDRVRLPWALAEIAKTSIVSGNEYRSAKVEARDVFQLCSEYNELDDPLRQRATGLSGTPAAFMVRMQYLQFPYQNSPFEEVARITALFENVDSLDTKIVSSAFLSDAIGCTLHDYVNAGIAICSVAQNRGGHFDPTWPALWNGPDSINHRFSMEIVTQVFHKYYLANFQTVKEETQQYRQSDQSLRQYEYNPLVEHPFVSMKYGANLAPQIHLAYRRMSPAAIYYAVVSNLNDDDGRDFTDDLGLIFQHYVGRQLALIPDATLVGEIHYDNHKRSVDWFLITASHVILIEAKATRMSNRGRMGTDQLIEDIDRCLGKAQRQIERSNELIRDQHPAFGELPDGLPRLGLTVTLEPYWTTTNPFLDRLLDEPSIPSHAISIRQLEQLVNESIATGSSSRVTDLLSSGTWGSSEILRTIVVDKNPILDASWNSNPLWDTLFESM